MNENLYDAYKMYLSVNNIQKAWECLESWYSCGDKTSYPIICDFRDTLNRTNSVEFRDIIRDSYDLTGRDHFDDFMIALEWDRPLKEKFWLPRRSKLMEICNALQDLEDNVLDELVISLPPRTGKTTIVEFFILWVILRDSERTNLYVSYSDTVVSVFYSGLLEILGDNDTYRWQRIFPNCTIASTNAKDNLLNIDRKKRYASFTARSLYGTLNGSCDCNGYLIGDDLISGIEEAMNKFRLDSAWSKVENNMLPRAKEHAKKLWIGTRWSIYDPISRRIDLVQNNPDYKNTLCKIVMIPALGENGESNFEYACGVGFTTEHYRKIRSSFEADDDVASWLAQYQQSPVERQGSVFNPSDLRYFNGTLPVDVEPDRKFLICDPAWGGGDYVSGLILYQYGTDLYLVDMVYDNSDKSVTEKLLCNIVIKHDCQAGYIEGTKMTSGYAEDVDKLLKDKGHRWNLQTTTKHFTKTGKEQRIFDKAPDIKENIVFLSQEYRSKEYDAAMKSLFSFTITGKNLHDDFPDSLAMAISFAFYDSVKLEIKSRRF